MFATKEIDGVNYFYKISSNNTITINSLSLPAGQKELIIPEVIDGMPVAAFECFDSFAKVFNSCERVVFPHTMSKIHSNANGYDSVLNTTTKEIIIGGTNPWFSANAFANFKALESVKFESTVCNLAPFMFASCTSLSNIDLTGISVIPGACFAGCTSLREVTIDAQEISNGAFAYCSSLETVNFSSELKVIENSAFMGCQKLETINGGANIKKIANTAFDGTALLKKSEMSASTLMVGQFAYRCPSGIVPEGARAFNENTFPADAIEVVLPDTIQSIETGSLWLQDLSDVRLPQNIESLSPYTFNFNKKLSLIEIPNQIKELLPNTFNFCIIGILVLGDNLEVFQPYRQTGTKVGSFVVSDKNPYFSSDFQGVLDNKDKTKVIAVPNLKKSHFYIPKTVKTFDENALQNIAQVFDNIVVATDSDLLPDEMKKIKNVCSEGKLNVVDRCSYDIAL